MKKTKKPIIGFLLVAVFLLDVIIGIWFYDYVAHPEKYGVTSAPWYSSMILSAVMILGIVFAFFTIYYFWCYFKSVNEEKEPEDNWAITKTLLSLGDIKFRDFVGMNAKSRLFFVKPSIVEGEDLSNLILVEREQLKYYPAFFSRESLDAYYASAGCEEYSAVEGTLEMLCFLISDEDRLYDVGIVIEPDDPDGSIVIEKELRL